ncbi:hypothetical protein FRC12_001394 [Ceratobasidium sp. 428]|nr:hypothetical protein FRC12_001394 [Ceratobasidium sp. 428]
MDPLDNLFKAKAVPNPAQTQKPNGLVQAIQKSHEKAAAFGANGDPHLWLTIPMEQTGNPHLDHALDNLRCSRYCLWLGDAHRILKNCTWVNGKQTYMSTLQWKANAPSRLVHNEGNTIIGFLGMVSTTGLTTGPKAVGRNKTFALSIQDSSNVPQIHWDTQLAGALRLVEDGCKVLKSGSHKVTHCFVSKEAGYLCLRSPIFAPGIVAQADKEDQEDNSSLVLYKDIPQSCEFATWNLTSEVQEAFERVIEQGFAPQVLEVYDRRNNLIHPNNITATLSGAIVIVYCTLEQMCFPHKNNMRNTEYQFYANLMKAQVIKNAPPRKPTSSVKRKFIHSYGQTDLPTWDNRSDGSGSAKKMRLNE